MARVNSKTPRAVLNPKRQSLVDSNFSTMWLSKEARVTAPAVFAFLNSSVAAALFEHTGSVMGGGALKLEATHLRSLPVPSLPATTWLKLMCLGSELANSSPEESLQIVGRIDQVLCLEMFGAIEFSTKLAELKKIIRLRQTDRGKNKNFSKKIKDDLDSAPSKRIEMEIL